MYVEGRALLAGLVLLMLTPIAVADGWKVKGALNQTVQYDDNISMKPNGSPAFGYLLDPSFGAYWNNPNMSFGITGSGDVRRYDDQRWDCEGFSLGINQQYQKRLNAFSLSGSYARSCSSSSQVSDDGIMRPNSQEETYSIAPAWSWQWSALDNISISPSYSKTSYSNTGSSGNTTSAFRGNETYSFNLSENHKWTRRLSSTISLFLSRSEFNNLNGPLKQSVFGFQIDNQYAITRKWSINVGGGLRWVNSPSDSQFVGSSSEDDSLLRTEIVNLALNYKNKKTTYSLAYSRTVSPSAFGQLNEYSSVNMRYAYQIARKWKFKIKGSFSKNKSIGQSGSQTNVDRTYYTTLTELVWDFAREWKLSARYRYRRQDYANSGDGQEEAGGTSNTIMFNLNYNWNGMRTSY